VIALMTEAEITSEKSINVHQTTSRYKSEGRHIQLRNNKFTAETTLQAGQSHKFS
jgi:hypothetical protein